MSIGFIRDCVQCVCVFDRKQNDEKIEAKWKCRCNEFWSLPSFILSIVCVPSVCGNTRAMIGLLLNANDLKIFINTQDHYFKPKCFLLMIFQPLSEIGFYTYDNNYNILEPFYTKPFLIFVFDNVASIWSSIIGYRLRVGKLKLNTCLQLM